MNPLRLVTFDATGTLLAFKTPVMEQYSAMAAKHGIQSNPKQLQENFKSAWKTYTEQHPNFGQSSGMGWKNWWRNVVFHVFKDTKVDHTTLSNIADNLINHFETENAWCVEKGVQQMVDTLHRRQLKMGIISNFDPRLHTILKNLNVDHYFEFVLTSYEVGYTKPDKGIFLEALKIGGVEKPDLALHIGNDEILDFQAATAVGLKSILIDKNRCEQPPYILNDISHVLKSINFFKSLN